MALERFDPEVRHMIILMYCLTIPLLATKAIRCACSLQMPAIRNFLESQKRGEVKLKNHAKVSGGHPPL